MTTDANETTIDVRDQRGRLQRFGLALAIGAAAALVAGAIAYWLSSPDQLSEYRQLTRAWRFVFYMAGLAGAGAFTAAQLLLSRIARNRAEANRIPRARTRRV